MHHLQFDKVLILEKLNACLGAPLINDIRFTLDASLGKEKTKEIAPSHQRPIPVKLPGELEQILGTLPDPELKDIIKRLWTKQHAT